MYFNRQYYIAQKMAHSPAQENPLIHTQTGWGLHPNPLQVMLRLSYWQFYQVWRYRGRTLAHVSLVWENAPSTYLLIAQKRKQRSPPSPVHTFLYQFRISWLKEFLEVLIDSPKLTLEWSHVLPSLVKRVRGNRRQKYSSKDSTDLFSPRDTAWRRLSNSCLGFWAIGKL